jgi:hypothetical protein
MFYDLTPGDRSKVKIPKQPERRERELRDLMRKNKHPVVLIVDEAHELHHQTLTGFKRLMELAASAGVVLSVLLIGHPKLRNDLRRPQMEEIGYRTTTFEFEGVSGSRREFISWLLKACAQDGVKLTDLTDADAIEILAERLRTALQIEMHLTLAFHPLPGSSANPTLHLVTRMLGLGQLVGGVHGFAVAVFGKADLDRVFIVIKDVAANLGQLGQGLLLGPQLSLARRIVTRQGRDVLYGSGRKRRAWPGRARPTPSISQFMNLYGMGR